MTRSTLLASATTPRPDRPAEAALIVTEAEAAHMLRLSARTLQRLRLDGGGPPYVMLTASGGRIGYAVAALQAWVTSRTVTSTAAASVAKAGAK